MTRTPRTTRTLRVLNAALAPVARGHRDPVGSWATAVAQVEKTEGGADRAFAEDLGRIVAGAAEIPRLSPLGWLLTLSEVKGRYANRLRINRLVAEHPQIAHEPITAPVVVCGLPRTATTLAHRVLSASSEHRAPLMWELAHTGLDDPRAARRVVKQLQQGADMMQRLAPDIRQIHPIYADRPEESMPVHGSYWPILHGLMPTYSAWLASRDPVEDYEYLKLSLQVLQYGRPRKRWVLKYPAYLAEMDTIAKVFPDATFVWTHRDPATVIGSGCSLVETFWGLYQTGVDPSVIGPFVLEHLRDQIQRGLQLRMDMPPSAIVDVPYHRLAADPHTEVPRLYAAIGATWTERDRQHLAEVIARPTSVPSHRYDLSRYVGSDHVAAAFGSYNRLLDRIDMRDTTPTVEL